MKTKIFLTVSVLFLIISAIGQVPDFVLTFSAEDNESYTPMDSIRVMNRSKECDTVLIWPDTVFCLPKDICSNFLGTQEINHSPGNLQVFQNYPNPAVNQTTISLFVPGKDNVNMIVTDILGRVMIRSNKVLERGYHSFRFIPGRGEVFFFTAYWQGTSSSIKILQTTSNVGAGSLDYLGIDETPRHPVIKRVIQSFTYSLGDTLLFTAYKDTLQSYLLDTLKPVANYSFQFAFDIPCPGMPTITYEGQTYNTVQIFNQCWLKENLNLGTMIPGLQDMENNLIIEKYCYNDNPANCLTVGGLYQWAEAVQYLNGATNISSWFPVPKGNIRGICPVGWHMPSDEEWKILEGVADTQYDYPDPEWNGMDFRGFDVGERLKSQTSWLLNGQGTDFFGFSVLASGVRRYDGVFLNKGIYTGIWSSTEGNPLGAWYRYFYYLDLQIARTYNSKQMGRCVRCIRDE